MSEKQDEGFAQRWSRLKQQARDEQAAKEVAPPAPPEAPTQAEEKAEEKKEAPFDPKSLPPVESLTKDSDYSLFMRPEVPVELRQKALRQLWATDPVLASPDLFDMHNLDYNAVPTFPEGVRSLYRVGRGLIDALEAEAEEKAAAEKAAGGEATDPAAESAAKKSEAQPQDIAAQQDDVTKVKDSAAKKT